jgi:hypothetical protein
MYILANRETFTNYRSINKRHELSTEDRGAPEKIPGTFVRRLEHSWDH